MKIRDYIASTPCKGSQYIDLLSKQEWKDKRKEILIRDKFQCQKCGFTSIPQIEITDQYEIFEDKNGQKYYVKLVPHPAKDIHYKYEEHKYITPAQVEFVQLEQSKRVVLIYNNVYCATEWSDIESAEEAFRYGCALHIYHYEIKGGGECLYACKFDYNAAVLLIEQPIIIEEQYTHGQKLQVHHKYYVVGAKPWEYHLNALITLCADCHKTTHANNTQIPILTDIDTAHYNEDYSKLKFDDKLTLRIYQCGRCGGLKFFPEYEHIENGICFLCRGLGYVIYDLQSNKILNNEIPLPSETSQKESAVFEEIGDSETDLPF